MARNRPYDSSDDDDAGYTSRSSSGDGDSISPSSASSSSSSDSPGSLGANGLTSADMELSGMGESMIGDGPTRPGSTSLSKSSPAQEAAQAAQRSSTQTARRSTGRGGDTSPISMAKKKGNQSR